MCKFLLLLLLSLPATAFAQTGLGNTKEHPIDRSLNACLEKNLSTQGMNGCLGQAYDAWDKELNRVYNELARKLQPDARAALKTAQLDWLKFRDEEFKLIASIYQAFEGTMYIPMQSNSRMQVVKSRTLALTSYLELIKEHQ
jgi:uncharacterized protein YecT (DUF1311 family)